MCFSSKCDYWEHCSLYRKDSDVCNKESGNAYGGFEFRPGGCYRDLDKNGKQSKYWVEKHEKNTNK
jgi:hypothetical protein